MRSRLLREFDIRRIGRNADPLLAESAQDGEIEIAAGGKRVFNVVDEKAQFNVECKRPKPHEENVRPRRAHDMRMCLRELEQDLAYPLHIAVVANSQLDADPSDRIAVGHVLDDAGDQILVRDHYACAIKRLDLCRPYTDSPHKAFFVLDLHPVSDAD